MGLKLFSDEDPLEDIKKAILQHEDTFRHQVHELHRLYWTQKNLMNGFASNDLGNHGYPFAWVPMRGLGHVAQWENKLPIWGKSLIPLDHSTSMLYHDWQRRSHSQLSVDNYGYHHGFPRSLENGLVCNELVVNPGLELTLGAVDVTSTNKGKGNVAKVFRKGYLDRAEVIDLDDYLETDRNEEEEATMISSLGPKTPIIISETRCEYKQSRCSDANEMTRKHLDFVESSDQKIAENAIINSWNHVVKRQHSLEHIAGFFDLNVPLPDESAVPSCELEDISSTESGSSSILVVHKSSADSYTNHGNVSSESSNTFFGKPSANVPETPVTGTQQSSKASSPLSCPGSCSNRNEDSQLEQLAMDATNTQLLMCVESEIADVPFIDLPSSNQLPIEEIEPFSVQEKSTDSVGCKDTPDQPVLAIITEPIICDNDRTNPLNMELCGDSMTCDGNDYALRWSEKVDLAVLLASTSLVHMSLDNPICRYPRDAEVRKVTPSGQPQFSIDSLEHIVLTMSENREVECTSSFKPTEEPKMNCKSRYSSRSGRQLRDFQRDILPGIVALSRHEICEDMHAFAEIIRSGEHRKKGMVSVFGRGNRYIAGRSRRPRRW